MNLKKYKSLKQEEDAEQENDNFIYIRTSDNSEKVKSYNITRKLYKSYNYIFYSIFFIFLFIFCFMFFLISYQHNSKVNEIKNNLLNNINDTPINNISNNLLNNTIFTSSNDTSKLINMINNISESMNMGNGTKIKIAFAYSLLHGNGISRFIDVTANNLALTGKYDIYLISGKAYPNDYKFHKSIKRVFAYNNDTLMKKYVKNLTLDFILLQNIGGKSGSSYYRKYAKIVIGLFHGIYMSAMTHGGVAAYRNYIDFDLYDAFVFISYDDYYFYRRLGFKNATFIPNLYTFDPYKTIDSNLTNRNILMIGRGSDPIKGFIYGIKTMPYIVKEVPDAILNVVSSNYDINFLKEMAHKLNMTNNIIFNTYKSNVSEVYLNSSILMYTSLSEAFPMAMNEGKAYGLPVVAFEVAYSVPYQSGVINVPMLDCEALANETIKLLKDYDYRKKMGREAKLSLNKFNNSETVKLWERLFDSLLKGREAYRELQNEIENKYYNEESAREHVLKHFYFIQKTNSNFSCFTIENFTDTRYTKNLQHCNKTNKVTKTTLINK